MAFVTAAWVLPCACGQCLPVEQARASARQLLQRAFDLARFGARIVHAVNDERRNVQISEASRKEIVAVARRGRAATRRRRCGARRDANRRRARQPKRLPRCFGQGVGRLDRALEELRWSAV